MVDQDLTFELTRAVNAGCGLACTIHANSAADALETVINSALIAWENVAERVVRKVFSSSIDLVVHRDRKADASNATIRRETMEVRAVVPSLHDDFSTEPLFTRDHLGGPMAWTGALPPESLVRRIESVLPERATLSSILRNGGLQW